MNEILIAGFGGQGILFMGKVLAYAGLLAEKEVSWLPSYGPEMRGGTANCNVIISDDPIGAPIVTNPDILMVLNRPSLDKFESAVKPGGTIIVDSTLVDRKVGRDDVNVVYIDSTKKAVDLNLAKLANIVMLGKLIKETSALSYEQAVAGLQKCVPASKPQLIELNAKAFDAGYSA